MTGGEPLPAGLRDRVLAASWRARPAGQVVPEIPAITAIEAFSRATRAFYQLLCALGEDDWRLPALRDLDVQGLVGHLIGVEGDVQRCLSGDPRVGEADHIESTRAAAISQAGRRAARTRAEWHAAVTRTVALASARNNLDVLVMLHGMRLPVRSLLVARAFEVWAHDNDIRAAAGLAPAVPDPAVLRLMAELAVELLPGVAVRTGLRRPARLHLVLTGPGGGTWDLLIGDQLYGTGRLPVGIVADVTGFCRLAANRVAAADLSMDISGDPGLAAAIVAAVPALALD